MHHKYWVHPKVDQYITREEHARALNVYLSTKRVTPVGARILPDLTQEKEHATELGRSNR